MKKWCAFISSSGQTFLKTYEALSSQEQLSLEAVFFDRDCPARELLAQNLPSEVKLLFYSKNQFEEKVLNYFEAQNFNGLILCCGFFKLLSENFIDQCGQLLVNTHPSLLPSFPGLDKSVHELASKNVAVSGFTVHLINKDLDAGAILFQHPVLLDAALTPVELRDKVRQAEQKWLPRMWSLLLSRDLLLSDGRLTSYEIRRKYNLYLETITES